MDFDPSKEPAVNPDAPAGAPDHKENWVDNGTGVPDPKRYYDPDFMQAEWDHMWTRTWLIAGVMSDIPEVGDYFTYDVGRESFILTRTGKGRTDVKAYFNVCPHRGNRLVHSDFGAVNETFTCSFHSWQWNLDGKLNKITDEHTFQPEVIAHRPCLAAVHVDVVGGIVFINMDDSPPPLREYLGVVADHIESFEIEKMRVVRHVVTEWEANWKTGIDAFYETYHLHVVHPETQGVMGDTSTQYDCYANGMSRMIVPIAVPAPRFPDQTTINPGLAAMLQDAGLDPGSFKGSALDVRPAIWQAKRQRAKALGLDYDRLSDSQLTDSYATGIFPNVQLGMHPEGAFLMKFMPHPKDPERFFYDTITLVRYVDDPNFNVPGWMGLPEGTDCSGEDRPDKEYRGVGEPPQLGQVLDQDSELLPVVQKGLRSRAFKGPLWGEQEQRVRHFHRELDRYLTGEK